MFIASRSDKSKSPTCPIIIGQPILNGSRRVSMAIKSKSMDGYVNDNYDVSDHDKNESV